MEKTNPQIMKFYCNKQNTEGKQPNKKRDEHHFDKHYPTLPVYETL